LLLLLRLSPLDILFYNYHKAPAANETTPEERKMVTIRSFQNFPFVVAAATLFLAGGFSFGRGESGAVVGSVATASSASSSSATTTTTTATTARARARRTRRSNTRTTLSFDFGWRHRAGLNQWPDDPLNDPPIDTTGIGYVDPGPFPEEASPSYITCDWIDVGLPHDGIISNPYGNAPGSLEACPNGCSGRSYIPRHVLWYRKQFRLPSTKPNPNESGNDKSWQDELLEGTSRIYLRFDGSFRNTTVYINGNRILQHECGYTPFRVELTPHNLGLLDNSSSNSSNIHTIAVFVDPNNGDRGGPGRGSGWWYEGGGLYRHAWIEKVSRRARIEHDSLFVKSVITSGGANHQNVDQSQTQSQSPFATLEIRTTFVIEDPDKTKNYCYHFTVTETGSEEPKNSTTVLQPLILPENSNNNNHGAPWEDAVVNVIDTKPVASAKLWTSSHPHLYEVTARLYFKQQNTTASAATTAGSEDLSFCDGATLLDEATVRHGIRSIRFDSNTGFYWNENPYKIRGFCDHDTFAVVGMAIPDRINLFRAQASRSIGGNARRASHNPPDPATLEIYDRLGMVVIDENRLFDNNTKYVQNFANLVKRDRNHPSVIVWSFCNEVGCEDDHETGGPAFQAVANELDGSRPTLANMFTFHDLLSDTIDVQGFSHQHRDKLDNCHKDMPEKPIVQSECCSCNTMRDVDEGCETEGDNPHTDCDQKSFNARCLQNLVNASDGTSYASGTFVWTLLDYYGEPPKGPMTVSSTYGQFDLCGFPKASAFWFRSQWLLSPPQEESITTLSDQRRRHLQSYRGKSAQAASIANGRPFDTDNKVEVHIVESWESPDHWNATRGNTTRTIHVYSNARVVDLCVYHGREMAKCLGKRYLEPMVDGDGGTYGEWKGIPWQPGTLIAVAKASDGGKLLASTRKRTIPLNPTKSLLLSLDCPSPQTGTGSALFLDGSDAALVRATVVDSQTNQTLVFADNLITFQVIQGPGKILGTANGDPRSKLSHTDSFHPAHHGLVRAVVGVTSAAGLDAYEKDLLLSMEVPSGRSDGSESAAAAAAAATRTVDYDDESDIVIEATSPGMSPVRLTIPTSTDRSQSSVLSVAARGAGRPVELVMGTEYQ
jgi:hypothetical protein